MKLINCRLLGVLAMLHHNGGLVCGWQENEKKSKDLKIHTCNQIWKPVPISLSLNKYAMVYTILYKIIQH